MYSGPPKHRRTTLWFRMAVWHSTLFCVSSILVFSVLYLFLRSSVRQRERLETLNEAAEYATCYKSGGIAAVEKQAVLEQELPGGNSMMVRLAGPENETLFFYMPDLWTDIDPELFGRKPVDAGRQWIYHRVINGKTNALIEIASLPMPDGIFLQVGQTTADSEELLGEFRLIFLGILIPAVFLSFAGGAFLASRTLRPLRDLIRTVRSIEAGNMESRVPKSRTQDEMDELVTLFNGMLEQIESLVRGMKASLDDVAHDLRTPMTRLRGIAELTLQSGDADADTLREALMDCAEESQRMAAMLSTLMDISEAETGVMKLNLEKVDLPALISDVVELYRDIADEKNISLRTTFSGPPDLIADANRVRQVVANLLDNAVKFTPDGGCVDIETSRKGECFTIQVTDTGVGIPPEDQPRIWDRLYRGHTSHAHRGLGLGLSLVKAVVHAHHGIIEVSSKFGQGTRFLVYLPLNPNSSC